MREKQMENFVAVDPSSNFPEEQTNFIRSLQDGGTVPTLRELTSNWENT